MILANITAPVLNRLVVWSSFTLYFMPRYRLWDCVQSESGLEWRTGCYGESCDTRRRTGKILVPQKKKWLSPAEYVPVESGLQRQHI